MQIGEVFGKPPVGYDPPELKQLTDRRVQMVPEGGIDWPMAELLAFGTLLKEGTPIRLAGQDRRGTFVQRHALIDKHRREEWTPLLYLGEGQARFWVYDSLLSEYAAMGFEYGYSVERPDALVLWEAQFGDFLARPSSTSSSAAPSRSGASAARSSCSCRTATRARTTARRGSSATCSCVPRTT